MPPGDHLPRYRLADLLIDVGRRTVVRSGSEIRLGKLSFDLLQALIEAAPNVVSNEQLSRAVWQGVVVSPETVTQRVKLLRDALGDDHAAPRYIGGLRGQGYRVLPPVILGTESPSATTPEIPQSIGRRTRSRWFPLVLAVTALGVGLAYVFIEQLLLTKHGEAAEPVRVTAPVAAFNPPPHSIAVLPFLNMSGDASQEYFADGITEELLNSLTHISELQVSARTSSFAFKGKGVKIATIARELNVGAILEGSVRRSGNTIRVTAQLDDAVTGFHLWSQTYDRDLSDVLKLQTDIANSVANALKVELLHDIAAKIELGNTRSPAALDAYLRASNAYYATNNSKAKRAAVEGYTEAIRLDPTYAIAVADRSLALTFYAQAYATGPEVRESFDRALSDAHRALALAPELGEAHLALAKRLEQGSLDFTQAAAEYTRAMALEPSNVRLLRDYGLFAVFMGHTDEGVAAVRRATVLDPLNSAGHTRLGWTLLYARRYSEAVAANSHGVLLNPRDHAPFVNRGLAYYALGDFEHARASCEVFPNEWYSQECLAITYEKLGRHADAQAELSKFKAVMRDAEAYQYAAIYAQWGDSGTALQWLETAVRLKDSGLETLKADFLVDPLRSEPRFQEIERALKFPN